MKKLIIVSFILAYFLFSQSSNAQQLGTGLGKWQLLGLREVKFLADKDVINVTNKKGTYRAIKLKVNNGSINIYRFEVFFGNGSSQELEVNRVVNKGGETRILDLKGIFRTIDRIELRYGTKGYSKKKAIVQVWGLH